MLEKYWSWSYGMGLNSVTLHRKAERDLGGSKGRFCMTKAIFAILFILVSSSSSLVAKKSTRDYIQALRSHNFLRQQEACLALADRKASAAVEPLIALLKDEKEDVQVRSHAAFALGQIRGNKMAVDALFELARDDSLPELRYASVMSLVILVGKNRKKDIEELALEMKSSKDKLIRDLALKFNHYIRSEKSKE